MAHGAKEWYGVSNDKISELPLRIDFIPSTRKNRPALPMKAKGITIHSTANLNVGALNHARYLNTNPEAENRSVSWHYTVDDELIVQHLPVTEMGWHAGDGFGPGNSTTIGIEICEFSSAERQQKAIDLTVKLVRALRGNLDLSLIYQHNYWDKNKDCPRILRMVPGGWEAFLSKIEEGIKMEKELIFKDVPPEHPHGSDILWVKEKGLMVGYPDGSFKPDEPITRGQMATVLRKIHRG